MEEAAQGDGGVPIPGGVQKTCRCGTLEYGLVSMVVLGGWLDLMILEVFSNLNDSMIFRLKRERSTGTECLGILRILPHCHYKEQVRQVCQESFM